MERTIGRRCTDCHCHTCIEKDKEIALLKSALCLADIRLNRVLGMDEQQIKELYKGQTNETET